MRFRCYGRFWPAAVLAESAMSLLCANARDCSVDFFRILDFVFPFFYLLSIPPGLMCLRCR